MELKIYWTDFSKKELQKIFDYYKDIANINIARKLVTAITREVLILKQQSTIGQTETALENQTKDFRYLVFKNYKIIYWINLETNAIEIFDVFDTRQNPVKIKRTK